MIGEGLMANSSLRELHLVRRQDDVFVFDLSDSGLGLGGSRLHLHELFVCVHI